MQLVCHTCSRDDQILGIGNNAVGLVDSLNFCFNGVYSNNGWSNWGIKCKNKFVGLFYTTVTTNIYSTNICNTQVTHEPQDMGTALPFQGRSLDNVRKTARVRNRYNQVPHLSQDTKWECNKITINITNKSQTVSLFLQGTTRQQSMTNTRHKQHE